MTEATEREAEKQRSRDADAEALKTGAKTRDQLRAENTFLSPTNGKINLDQIGGPKPAGEACAKCPLRDNPCVHPEPAPKGQPKLAIVGESPGRNEVRQGRPFIGASGRLLGRGLRTLGLKRSDVHWTNAVLCDCPNPKDMSAARKACSERLRKELEGSRAPIVMPVGAWGLQSAAQLPRKPSILKWRGTITQAPHYLLMPTIHPAFVMRAPKWGIVLETDVERVGRIIENGYTPPEERQNHRMVVVQKSEELSLLAGLGTVVGYDVETTWDGPIRNRLVCLGLSDGDLTIVIPWSRDAAGQIPYWREPSKVAGLITNTLRDRVAVTHNGPCFDHIVSERYGIHVGAWEDTLLMRHSIAGHLPKALDFTVSMHLDAGPWKQWEHSKAIEDLWVYNGRDCLYTVLAYHELRKEINANNNI